MTSTTPVEVRRPCIFVCVFVSVAPTRATQWCTELLFPFIVDSVRAATDPWAAAVAHAPARFGALAPFAERFAAAFAVVPDATFASAVARAAPLAVHAAATAALAALPAAALLAAADALAVDVAARTRALGADAVPDAERSDGAALAAAAAASDAERARAVFAARAAQRWPAAADLALDRICAEQHALGITVALMTPRHARDSDPSLAGGAPLLPTTVACDDAHRAPRCRCCERERARARAADRGPRRATHAASTSRVLSAAARRPACR